MNPYQLTAFIASLSIVIADNISDLNELELLAVSVTQLGDTLATIATQRAIAESQQEAQQ